MESAELNEPQKHIPINVWLAGRSYRILVEPAEEAALRYSVKKADEQIAELRQHYAGKDDQDFVAMCLLLYAAETTKAAGSDYLTSELNTMIARIDQALEKR